MGKITSEMVEKSYQIGKQFYNNGISLKDGTKELNDKSRTNNLELVMLLKKVMSFKLIGILFGVVTLCFSISGHLFNIIL